MADERPRTRPAEQVPPVKVPPNDPRVRSLRERIAARLRRSVPDMDPAVFDRVVDDLARLKVSWADRYGDRLDE